MSLASIVNDRTLSPRDKITRLRDLEVSIRSLDRALFAGADDDPWSVQLAEIAREIRALEQRQRQ
ncbi:hypothetical protein PV773_08270 [Mesorhizobium sp. CC13]|uniref:hypothetical protein n=1 Tax=Mesorhizobium sp. CC13 TaxID=3029194 RepID=UPI0032635658